MKTYLLYGGALAIANGLLTMLLYLLGFHSDLAKLGSARMIGGCGGVVITILCVALGTKARREEFRPSEEYTYGQALLSGFMISLFASLLGIVTWVVYAKYINPEFPNIIAQAQAHEMEAKGMRPEQIEGMQKAMTNPYFTGAISFFVVMIIDTVISLITAAFLRRPAEAGAPPAIPS